MNLTSTPTAGRLSAPARRHQPDGRRAGAAGGGADGGPDRARSHCRFVPPLTHFIPDELTYSVPLFLNRQCGRTPGGDILGPAGPAGAKDAELAQNLGQPQHFIAVFPPWMHGPTCILWANLSHDRCMDETKTTPTPETKTERRLLTDGPNTLSRRRAAS